MRDLIIYSQNKNQEPYNAPAFIVSISMFIRCTWRIASRTTRCWFPFFFLYAGMLWNYAWMYWDFNIFFSFCSYQKSMIDHLTLCPCRMNWLAHVPIHRFDCVELWHNLQKRKYLIRFAVESWDAGSTALQRFCPLSRSSWRTTSESGCTGMFSNFQTINQ